MTPRAAGHGAPVHSRSAAPAVSRVQSDNPRQRRSFGNTGTSTSTNGGAPKSSPDAGAKAGQGKGIGLSLNETIQRVQVSWEQSMASRNSVVSDVYAEMQRMKSVNGAANGNLGKRSSMGFFEDTQERKRRAVEGDSSSVGTNGRELGGSGSGTPSAPAAVGNGTSSTDKARDRGAQVLRAVRSAHNKVSSPTFRAKSKDTGMQVLEKAASGRHYKSYVGKSVARSHGHMQVAGY